jgi:hypothetical protein
MIRRTPLISSLLIVILPAGIAAAADAAQGPPPIEEIHLVHQSHTDLGFTDLGSTALALHVGYIRQALDFADATADYPIDARFRWTCESALVVERFLREATAAEKARFAAAVRRGQIEVTAMPDNLVDLIDGPEWAVVVRRLEPLWKAYGVRVALQDDVNGFPWGLLPALHAHGIDAVWMGSNGDTSVPLTRTPEAWWWEGPDGQRTLVWSGKHYCYGYELFHSDYWRRGPVPPATSVWFNPPAPGETWSTTSENLAQAERILRRKLAGMSYYRHPVIAFQVTNMYRMDNDPPSRQLADFVRAWNRSGRRPRLVTSTPSRFLARLCETAGSRITTVRRGDWQDWWSDGVASTPELLAANQQAKRTLADLPAAARLLGENPSLTLRATNPSLRRGAGDVRSPALRREVSGEPPEGGTTNGSWRALSDAGWDDAIFFDEHTWGSYWSIAQPYHRSALGGAAEKTVLGCRAAERAALARTALLRTAKDFCDFSRTRRFRVLNPGPTPRSGWVEIPADAIRFSCNAAHELRAGKTYPLEDVREPTWSDPDLRSAPFDIPNDVWSWQVSGRRFLLADVPPGQTIDFELVDAPSRRVIAQSRALTDLPGKGLSVTWQNGSVASLRTAGGLELVDARAPHALGQVVLERLKDPAQRQTLASRDQQLLQKQFIDEPAGLVSARTESTPYASSLITVWRHPLLDRVEQRWDVLKFVPRAELTTTIWIREAADPMAIYLAFPFALSRAQLVYGSVGHETVFGADSLPGSCAETLCQNNGLMFRNSSAAVLLATPDTPVGCPGGTMLRRRVIAPAVPAAARYYINIANNYWHTNFPILKASKLVLRHWIQPADAKQASLKMLSDELWAYPIR